MGEGGRLLTVLGILYGIAVLSVIVSGIDPRALTSEFTASYRAVIDLDETITLKESYFFDVRKGKRFSMLYRKWNDPLLYGGSMNSPHISVVTFGGDGLPYLKDKDGRVFAEGADEIALKEIGQRAEENEVGIFRREKFPEGEYRLFAEYEVYPPIREDDASSHINIKLADRHIFYTDVEIIIRDGPSVIKEVFPHLASYTIERTGNIWMIKGKSPTDTLLEVEILTSRYPFRGYSQFVSNVEGKTRSANSNLMIFQSLRNAGKKVLIAGLFFYPFILIIIYWLYGSERSFTVPQHLSFIPDPKKKPWLVNMLFSGNAEKTDENALYATLIDMERKGLVEILQEEGKVRIKVKSRETKDSFERKVLNLLEKYAPYGGGYFDPEEVEKLVDSYVSRRDEGALERVKRDFEDVINFSDPLIVRGFLSTEGHRIVRYSGIGLSILLALYLIGMYIFAGVQKGYVYDLLVLGGGMLVSLNLPHLLLPPQVFGRWKRDFYREKLKWNAFKSFLSDLAMIKKYQPEDVAIWEEWLIYGTALGVADSVESAMKDLNIKVPTLSKTPYVRRRFYHTYRHVHSASVPKASGTSDLGGFGGFGAGGGFGGGGAGGR